MARYLRFSGLSKPQRDQDTTMSVTRADEDIASIDHEAVFTIRRATVADSEPIAFIWRPGIDLQKWPSATPPHQNTVDAFRRRLDKPEGESKIFVAESKDGTVIGWQGLLDLGITQITRCFLSSTYIHHGWHRRGIGRALLSHAMACSKRAQGSRIFSDGFARTTRHLSN